MQYGFCTNFATQEKYAIEWDVVALFKKAGYNYVEFPLMTIADMSVSEYQDFLTQYHAIGIPCLACSNMFPARINLTGDAVDYAAIDDYLDIALARCNDIGVKLLVFGSAGARNLPEGASTEQGLAQLQELLKYHVAPKALPYGILTVIEPIRPSDCNLVTTIAEGAHLCQLVGEENIQLLVDSYQMDNDPAQIGEIAPCLHYIKHVHVSEAEREIPKEPVSIYLDKVLRELSSLQYQGTVSMETNLGNGLSDVTNALAITKAYFQS